MEIEAHFSKVCGVVLGKPLTGLRDYGEWLLSRAPEARINKQRSAASGQTVYVASAKFFLALGKRVVKADEALGLGEKKISQNDAEALTIANAQGILSSISTTTPEIIWGKNFGTEESCAYGPTQHCFRVAVCWWSKYAAYSYWTRTSDNIFGCSICTDCSFCIKCYSSTKLTRCFEVNDSNNCADCYFCHNCEDLRDCMFCFNAKGKRHAIGNVELPREEYLKVKGLILQSIVSELEMAKNLGYDIYNIGATAASV